MEPPCSPVALLNTACKNVCCRLEVPLPTVVGGGLPRAPPCSADEADRYPPPQTGGGAECGTCRRAAGAIRVAATVPLESGCELACRAELATAAAAIEAAMRASDLLLLLLPRRRTPGWGPELVPAVRDTLRRRVPGDGECSLAAAAAVGAAAARWEAEAGERDMDGWGWTHPSRRSAGEGVAALLWELVEPRGGACMPGGCITDTWPELGRRECEVLRSRSGPSSPSVSCTEMDERTGFGKLSLLVKSALGIPRAAGSELAHAAGTAQPGRS